MRHEGAGLLMKYCMLHSEVEKSLIYQRKMFVHVFM